MPSLLRRPDRLFVAPEPPYAAAVIVHRRRGERTEFLILHSSSCPPAFEGDWAWSPPTGERLPGESVEACARREVEEETGLQPSLRALRCDEDCAWFAAEVEPDARIALSEEHDRFEWVDGDTARLRCRPSFMGEMFGLDLEP